jgi:predicted anti-sigma-YlaC factor YlaD
MSRVPSIRSLRMRFFYRIHSGLLILGTALLSGCSIQQIAINSLSNVLAEGNSVFESDNDPAFIAEALPFSLKLIDALLSEQPDHQGLLLSGASGYVFYSYAYLDTAAEQLSRDDIDAGREMRARARNLFLRAHDYASRALAVSYPGIDAALFADPETAVRSIGSGSERDLELLYWNAVSLGLAISTSRNDAAMLARMPEVDAQLSRALELDESWNQGSLHELAITAAPLTNIDDDAIAEHYERALDLSGGKRASLYISYAEATAVPHQDRAAFVELLQRALAVDIDRYPELRLVNTVAQHRAEWLLDNIDELFLE